MKAAALRNIFGRDAMAIGNLESGEKLRIAQGPKSRAFHFKAPLCGACNSTRTQSADKEFDCLHEETTRLLAGGQDPRRAFDLERYEKGSVPYLDVFRYFAKLMCCHLAESGGPRPIAIARFAIGEIDRNPVSLHIDADPTYSDFAAAMGEHQYAAHGGLVVITDPETGTIAGFRTSLTLGPVRYLISIDFDPLIALALRVFHKPFADKCLMAYRAALENPIPPAQRRKLGV